MKRQWRLRRELLAAPDGQQRWDRAYQALLSWAEPATLTPPPATGVQRISERKMEVGSVHSDLRAGVDAAPGAGADD